MNDGIECGLLVVLMSFREIEAFVEPRGECPKSVAVEERQRIPVRSTVGDARKSDREDAIRLVNWRSAWTWSEGDESMIHVRKSARRAIGG